MSIAMGSPIRRHRARKHAGLNHMALIPFIDMMTILVVFLLVHTADVDILPNTKSISIPQSVSLLKPHETVVVMATKDMIFVNGRPVTPISEILGMPDDQSVVPTLRAALVAQADSVLRNAAKDDQAAREITIMGDKTLPYKVLKRLMATCTDANYGKVSLAVVEQERAATRS
jgi:biopolymer transport protein ExbD